MTSAFYPGTFDPITLGHEDIIKKAAKLFDNLIIGVGVNINKRTWFNSQDRRMLVLEVIENKYDLGHKVEVVTFDGLTVEAAKKYGCQAIIRGLRAVTDFEFEFQMAHINRELDSNLQTVFIPASTEHTFISSSMVKELFVHQRSISKFVSPTVELAMKHRPNTV